jgi:hypothetical protein
MKPFHFSTAFSKELKMRVRYAIGIAVAAALLSLTAAPSQAQTPAPVLKKSAPPTRGTAELGYVLTQKREGKMIVTTFQVKNLAAGSIAGLTITEFWYDKAGNALQGTGDRQRLRLPLQPGEITTLTMRSPEVPGMNAPQYKFEHSNGQVKPTKLTAKDLKQ